MEKVYAAIRDLTEYALATGLIEKEDVIYTVNSLLGALGIDDYPGNKEEIIEGAGSLDRAAIEDGSLLEGILAQILDYAAGKDMLDGSSVVMRDLFDTKIMGIVTPRPSDVIAKFRGIYSEDPLKATDWYYDFSCSTDYIRRSRRKPPDHPDHDPGKSLGIPVFALCVLQRALHRVQFAPYTHGDQSRYILQAVRLY